MERVYLLNKLYVIQVGQEKNSWIWSIFLPVIKALNLIWLNQRKSK